MKIISLGVSFFHDSVTNSNFDSFDELLDYDLALVDLQNFWHSAVTGKASYKNNGYLNKPEGDFFFDVMERRRDNIINFVNEGRFLVIFPLSTAPVRAVNSSGTLGASTDISDYLLGTGSQVNKSIGFSIEGVGKNVFSQFIEKISEHLQYRAVFEKLIGEKIAVISKTDKVIASVIKKGEGKILFCPSLKDYGDPGRNNGARNNFINCLLGLCEEINKENRPIATLPSWHATYFLPKEEDLNKEKTELETKIVNLRKDIDHTQNQIEVLHGLKHAFTEKGDILVDVIKILLEQLGFEVEFGPEGRDDLIAKYKDISCVLEVKGRDNSGAAEKDSAQLEKWASRFYEENNCEPKAILIVNGYRDLPLQERTAPIFPDQMLSYAKRKEQCLLSSLQLLCLVLSCKNDVDREKAISELTTTVGVFLPFSGDGWRDIICMSKAKNE